MLQQYAVYDDTYVDNFHTANAVYNSKVTSLLHCAMLCLEFVRCLSYFYNIQSEECTLHAISFRNTVPSHFGEGWKFYLTEDRSGRCSPEDGFIYYRDLDLCYKIYDPVPENINVLKLTCDSANAELIKVDTQEKQKYVELISADFPVPKVCIQGTDTIDPQQQWTFDDGTLMTYFNWNQQCNEPSGGKGNLGISIVYNFTWKWSLYCSRRIYSLQRFRFLLQNLRFLPTNFNEFKEVCRKANAELVRVDTEQKQKYIELIAENLPVTQLCIQGTDTIVHNQWTFDDGTIMTYFKWNKEYNEPGGNQGNIGIQIVYNFTWWDIVGKWPNVPCVFICEQYKIY
ncbi:unnamed protein product [Mytilus coruscus]|uniref:C-type lectin domain-containing protein n=1 Tax=Mytilus coruscus TaxID=42192 RepID=A0A6J8EDL6_MYTCO|nr:unnamed protein product [Mytilus coruscus]